MHGKCAIDFVTETGISDARCPICKVQFPPEDFTAQNIQSVRESDSMEQSRLERGQEEAELVKQRVEEARKTQSALDVDAVNAQVRAQRLRDWHDYRPLDTETPWMPGVNDAEIIEQQMAHRRNLLDAFDGVAGSTPAQSLRPARSAGSHSARRYVRTNSR
jgi:hypothetical protein